MSKKCKLPPYILLCYLLNFYVGFNMSGIQFVLLDIKTEFGLSSTLMAAISSAQMITALGMSALFSGLLDRLDNKKTLLVGCLCSIGGSLLAGFARGPMWILCSYLISGVGGNILLSVPFPAMAKLDPERITLHVNRQQGALSCGAFLSPLFFALLMGRFGLSWRWNYYVNTLLLGALTLFLCCLPSPGRSGETEADAPETPEERRARRRLVLTPAFLCMGLCLGLYMFMEIGLLGYAKDYFVLELGDAFGAALCISAVRGGMTLSRLFGERLLKNRVHMCLLSMALPGACLACLALFRRPVPALLACLLFGVFAGPCWPTVLSMGLSIDPKASGKLTSLLMLFNNLGNNLGNLLIGACVDAMGVANAYYVAAGAAVLGVVSLLVGVRSFRRLGLTPEGPEWLAAREVAAES